jgi:stage II sporulation protein AB (anti-sigma F factor)
LNYSLDRFTESLPAQAENVRALRRGVAEFARRHGATGSIASDAELAVAEALNNVVVHAYSDRAHPGPMTVEAHVEMQQLAIAVIDEGQGLRPRLESPGAGFGLPVMASVTTKMHFEINRDGSGTVVILNFALA